MTTEQTIDLALAIALLCSGAIAFFRVLRDSNVRTRAAAGIVLTAIVFVARFSLVRPALLHANFHGIALVESIVAFPEPNVHRKTYGYGSFVVLGAIARIAHRNVTSIVVANQLFGVLTLLLCGLCAARWSGRARTLPLTLAAGALWPPLVRVNSSEDAHTLAVLLGWIAVLAMDLYARDRRRAALLPATAALLLSIHTRQTLYPWAVCAYALALSRGGSALVRRSWFVLSVLVVFVTLAVRLYSTANDPSERITLVLLPRVLATPETWIAMVRHHPLFDVSLGSLVGLPLGVTGLACLRTQRWFFRTYIACLVGYFLLTLPFALPAEGVELAFRLPVSTLWLVAVAVGADALLHRAMGAIFTSRCMVVFAGIALSAAFALPGWSRLRTLHPVWEEYMFVRAAASSLPRDAFFVVLAAHDPAPAYFMPRRPLVDAGLRPRFVTMDELRPDHFRQGPVLFLSGLQCRAYSSLELVAPERWDHRAPPFERMLDALVAAYRRRLPDGVQVPSTLRPECKRLLRGAVPFGPARLLGTVPSENPFTLYGPVPVVLRFYRLAAPQ